eukprot:gene11243-18868_t
MSLLKMLCACAPIGGCAPSPKAQEDATHKRFVSTAFAASLRVLRIKSANKSRFEGNAFSLSQQAAVLGASPALLQGDSRSSESGTRDAPNLQGCCPAPKTVENLVEACSLPCSSGSTPLMLPNGDMNPHPDAFESLGIIRQSNNKTALVNDPVQFPEARSDASALLASSTDDNAAFSPVAVDPVAQSSPGFAQRPIASPAAFLDKGNILDSAFVGVTVDNVDPPTALAANKGLFQQDNVAEVDNVDPPKALAASKGLLQGDNAAEADNVDPPKDLATFPGIF